MFIPRMTAHMSYIPFRAVDTVSCALSRSVEERRTKFNNASDNWNAKTPLDKILDSNTEGFSGGAPEVKQSYQED
jgi:hypothetical protein